MMTSDRSGGHMLRVAIMFAVVALALATTSRADIPPPYELYGVGASMAEGKPFPTIAAVTARSPAAQAGLKVGDAVIALNSVYANGGEPFYYFARGLQGPQDSQLQIVVLRDNRE